MNDLPTSVPYKTISRTHAEYTPARWAQLDDLYRGGLDILDRAETHLPRLVGEHASRYKERVKSTAYVGYLGQIVDFFGAHLFANELQVMPAADADDPSTPGEVPDPVFYGAFGDNVDLAGTTFSELMRGVFTSSIVKGKALIGLDFPQVDEVATSAAAEEELGTARAYAFVVQLEELINWQHQAVVTRRERIAGNRKVDFEIGVLSWAVLRQRFRPQPDPFAPDDVVVEEFKVWTMGPDGRASWAKYAIRYPSKEPPKDDAPVPLVGHGATTFPEIPIVEVKIPPGLWIGSKVGPLNLEHWRRRSLLQAAERKSLVSIPWVKQGPEIGGVGGPMPSEVTQDPHRGEDPVGKFVRKGWLVLGHQDSVGFAASPTGPYALVGQELKELVDEIFRVAHQMAASISSTANAVGRSGESKLMDQSATNVVLAGYEAIMGFVGRRLYRLVSRARGETVVWIHKGLDKFDVFDRAAVFAEALELANLDLGSRTAMVALKTQQVLRLLPPMSASEQETVRAEIAASIPHEQGRIEDKVGGKEPPAPKRPTRRRAPKTIEPPAPES